jgi:GNAT superfamily N-acetyltransferase
MVRAADGEEGAGAPLHGLCDNMVLLAVHDGEVCGYAHAASEQVKDWHAGAGIIRFFAYERGNRAAGKALLDAVLSEIRNRTSEGVLAFPSNYRYPCYHFLNANLSNHLDHVEALLGVRGFRRQKSELFLDMPNLTGLPTLTPPIPCELVVERVPGRGKLPGFAVRAFRDGELMGECVHTSGQEYSPRAEAGEWAFCTWLGVKTLWQGKGLGEFLLTRALGEAKELGYSRASISTAGDNYRAFTFYSNHGYRVVDWTYGLRLD